MKDPQQNTDSFDLDPDLLAYVDDRLPPEKMAEIEARLAGDVAARDAVAQWRHDDEMIRQAALQADDLPLNLRTAALEKELATKLKARQRRAWLLQPSLRQIAASAVIFAAGWGANGYFNSERAFTSSQHPIFVEAAISGHYAYSYAQKVSAEFSADEIEAALDWMSDRMQYKITSPKLERLGYQVETARLVTENGAPMAVFYLRNAADDQVTVSMTPQTESDPVQPLRIVKMANDNVAYWSERGMYYTIVAKADSGMMTSLAAAVLD